MVEIRDRLSMIKPVSYDTQCQRFYPAESFLAALAICHDTGKIRYLGYPAAIFFSFYFNPQDSEASCFH